ncbi:hypothetical protein BH24ACT15_BH24ACT15_31680 [soil metagenome]|jgi:Flp pilus assembly protein TadG
MRTPRLFQPHQEGGQALVILAVSLSALLAMSALIIDGGNAMAQQRATQNGADAASLSAAAVLVEDMSGANRSDADVLAAVQQSLSVNESTLAPGGAVYVDYNRNVVGNVGGGSIPSSAGGVSVTAARTFGTFLAGIAGMTTMNSGAQATALAGAVQGICAASEGCAMAPVTFSIPVRICDGTNRPLRIGAEWPLVSLETALADTSKSQMSSVPLCTNGPGGVGWLDMRTVGCTGNNLAQWITTPCNRSFDIPIWLRTEAGNMNNVESAMDTYRGQVILIPMFDSTCRDVPSSGLPADCTDPGNGNNLWYHIPQFAAFLLDDAHIQGDNRPACQNPPGLPLNGGNGSTSCIDGWFIKFVTVGPVGPPRACADPTACVEPILATQLVR